MTKQSENTAKGDGSKQPDSSRIEATKEEQDRAGAPDPNTSTRTCTRPATGPRTKRGKAAASMNALRHGLLSRAVVIKTLSWSEDEKEYKRLLRQHHNHYQPKGPGETAIVEIAVAAIWRYARFFRAEGAAILLHRSLFENDSELVRWQAIMQDKTRPEPHRKLAEGRYRERREEIDRRAAIPHPLEIERLQRYEAHLLRIYFRALNELERLQRMRLGDAVPPPLAVDIQN